jgi:RsiW-degrading membrane proteinase PrsW (M82 family)
MGKHVNLGGFLGAGLIVIVWLYFLKRLDIFEPEKNRYLLATLVGGMLFSFLATFFYDVLHFYLGFDLGGTWLKDLLYCVFGIGVVEELVKLIPFLLMVKFSKQVNESVDFVIYASASALGFSFVENLLYFGEQSLFIIEERGMICSIGHMFYTSLIAYGIVLAKYRKKGTVAGNVVIFFLLACAFHGLYDFWLNGDDGRTDLALLSLVLAMVEVIIFSRIINNALNQSEFFEEKELNKLNHLRERLGVALMSIVVFEYVVLAWKYGPELTRAQFADVFGFTWLVVFFLSFNLSHYTLRQRLWVPIRKRRKRQENGFVPE